MCLASERPPKHQQFPTRPLYRRCVIYYISLPVFREKVNPDNNITISKKNYGDKEENNAMDMACAASSDFLNIIDVLLVWAVDAAAIQHFVIRHSTRPLLNVINMSSLVQSSNMYPSAVGKGLFLVLVQLPAASSVSESTGNE